MKNKKIPPIKLHHRPQTTQHVDISIVLKNAIVMQAQQNSGLFNTGKINWFITTNR